MKWVWLGMLAVIACAFETEAGIELKRTAAAPEGANGTAEIDTRRVPQTLSVEIEGLGPGYYTVGVVRRSDGSDVPVGYMAIQDPTLGPEDRAGQNRKEDDNSHQAEKLRSRAEIVLPQGLDASDVGKIVVVDEGGVVVLEGETNPKQDLKAKE
jgi:hypothetical protein